MATETDAARDRVLAARTEFDEELIRLEASGRAALDIPAKIRRSPAKAVAVVGGLGFLALKGPQRVVRVTRRVVRGKSAPLPERMLPDEVEKTLRRMGSDGDKVRGTLERDFAAYAKQSANDRQGIKTLLLLTVARPLLARGAKSFGEFLFSTDDPGINARIDKIRARIERATAPRDGGEADDARRRRSDGLIDRCGRVRRRGIGGLAARRPEADRALTDPSPRPRRQRELCQTARGRVAEWQTRRP